MPHRFIKDVCNVALQHKKLSGGNDGNTFFWGGGNLNPPHLHPSHAHTHNPTSIPLLPSFSLSVSEKETETDSLAQL